MQKMRKWMIAGFMGLLVACGTSVTHAADRTAAASKSGPRSFASPDEAVTAFVDALRAENADAVFAVLGSSAKGWLSSGDSVADATERKRFLAAYDRKHTITRKGDAVALLNVGVDEWPFPAPIVSKAGKWSFDTEAGREEVLSRRIGRNELNTIQTLLAIVDAQRDYASTDADGNGLADYASRFMSTPGKRDGLHWPVKAGESQSPLGPLVVKAVREGYGAAANAGKPVAYHGYYYRMLTAQGSQAGGGAFSYLVNGRMFGGFAVIAYPASYGNSGVKTFIVNHDGVVYERDLGTGTVSEAGNMKLFNPDAKWKKVD